MLATMPALAQNPSQLSKDQLRSRLISHNVPLPQGDQKKDVYLHLYLNHVFHKDGEKFDFSSDEEDTSPANSLLPVGDLEEGGEDNMDVKSLSNTELKEQLLKRGVKPGPILPSTRSVYERKLQQLMEALVKHNGPGNEDRYSDSEDEEGAPMKNEVQSREKIDMRTRNEMYNKAKVFTVNVPVRRSSLSNGFNMRPPPGPYTHIPASLAAEYNQNLANLGDDFSVTRILKQMERRSSLGHVPMHKREQDSKSLPSQPDADSPDLPDPMSQSLLGMSATRRKPIKGAAGRPIQFRYDDLATKARMQEHTQSTTVETGKKRLVSVPLQIALFLLIAFIAVVLLTMEGSPENPFVSLSEKTAESGP